MNSRTPTRPRRAHLLLGASAVAIGWLGVVALMLLVIVTGQGVGLIVTMVVTAWITSGAAFVGVCALLSRLPDGATGAPRTGSAADRRAARRARSVLRPENRRQATKPRARAS